MKETYGKAFRRRRRELKFHFNRHNARETAAKIVEATISPSAPFLCSGEPEDVTRPGETGDNAMRKIAIVGGGQSGSQLALSLRALFLGRKAFSSSLDILPSSASSLIPWNKRSSHVF